ncbi:M24 family metallopeptidase [Paralimibaculum aggregatum]|nr:Xaa-Pro peptidase family protein [Limibaculum sp. NKW23]
MLHFTAEEFADRLARTRAEMAARGLDALLVFSPESQYWLTGYDTFGFCFFQCLVISEREPVLLTRSADLRQAELTSTIADIRVWRDRAGAQPADDLAALLGSLGLAGRRIGWETRTHGLTHANGAAVAARVPDLVEASDLISGLRLVKSPAEIAHVREAARLGDLAWEAGLAAIGPGAGEAAVLAAMQNAVLAEGGDYPANEFIVGSGAAALLCRYQAGRRQLGARDQITLEWAGVSKHYHSALMKTVVVGEPTPRHRALQAAAEEALAACEAALTPGGRLGDVFDAHARVLDGHGLGQHRLNACGYSLGARFAPSWMEDQMLYEGAPAEIRPGMVIFIHMILMESPTQTAMCLGRTSLVGARGAEPLSAMPLGLVTR